MKDFIKEFYYGNIDPQARSIKQSKAVMKEMQTLNETEEYLTFKRLRNREISFYFHLKGSLLKNPRSASALPFASARRCSA